MIKKKINNEDLLKYEEITKDYDPLRFAPKAQIKKKIRYMNPDDVDKVFEIESTDDDIVNVRNKELNIESKASEFIRLLFNAPETLGSYKVCVIVKNKANKEVEEVLRFHIQVNNS